MISRSSIEAERELLALRDSHLLKRLTAMDAYGEDVWEDSTVITFRKAFTVGGTEYHYAAIKAASGGWYVTGKDATRPRTWEELISLFTERGPAPEVFVCTEMTALEDTRP